uniref:Uncharacterized protein n=1 Tax=Anguilla anguilla TaxID=7936 RepID=A0A0E9ST51_ANGAN
MKSNNKVQRLSGQSLVIQGYIESTQ